MPETFVRDSQAEGIPLQMGNLQEMVEGAAMVIQAARAEEITFQTASPQEIMAEGAAMVIQAARAEEITLQTASLQEVMAEGAAISILHSPEREVLQAFLIPLVRLIRQEEDQRVILREEATTRDNVQGLTGAKV
jgi:hypothetical protein